MNFDNETRTRIFVNVTTTMDPTGSSVELQVDGVWQAATWMTNAVHHDAMGDLPERWTRQARTTNYFAGPDMSTPSGAVVLAEGRHEPQVRITNGGDVVVGHASVIDVVD